MTESKKRKFILRTIGGDDQQGSVASNYITIKAKPEKVAVPYDNSSYGQGIARALNKDLEAAKIPVARFKGINAGDSGYSAIVTKLKSQGVDLVYFGGD